MTSEKFVKSYERALATQDWQVVEPLIHEDACVTFSNGTVHKGRRAVQSAFEKNFEVIADEEYRVTNVHWVQQDDKFAVYLFDFEWSGSIAGKPANGKGRGTTVLVREGNSWQLLVEHLGA